MTEERRNRVTNTANQDPLDQLAVAMFGGIENQEAQGQREVVNSDVLPKKCTQEVREQAEALGIVFGDPVPGDDLFVEATLPVGWKREGSGHALWSYLVDTRGVRRVAIFYKAAFYDRDAFLSILKPGYEWAKQYAYTEASEEFPKWDRELFTLEELEDAIDYSQRQIDLAVKYHEEEAPYSKYREYLNCLEYLKGIRNEYV